MDTPELHIPVAFAFNKSDLELAKTLKKLEEGAHQTARATKGIGDAVEGVVTTFASLATAKQIIGMIGEQARESADYIKGMVEEFIALRGELQQVAALTGKQTSNEFTVEQVQQASEIGMKASEWRTFQEEFQSVAGAYIDDGPKGKLNQAQGVEYQKMLAAFAKARGVSAEDVAGVGGGILQFSEGKQTVSELQDRVAKVFTVLERAPTKTKQLLPLMSRIMGQGASPEEAAQLLGIASEFAPGEEATFATQALKGVNEAILEGHGKELGVSFNQTPLERVTAAATTLGKLDEAHQQALFKKLGEVGKETRGLIGYAKRGVNDGGFERTKDYIEHSTGKEVDEKIAAYRASDAGQYALAWGQRELARAQRGAASAPVETERLKAEAQLIKDQRFEKMGLIEKAYRGAMGVAGGQSVQDQLIGEKAIEQLLAKRGIHMTAGDRIPFMRMLNWGPALHEGTGGAESMSRLEIDQAVLAELKKQTAIAAAAAKTAPAPLSAPPPPSNGARLNHP